MGMATSRHEPPGYGQAGHVHDLRLIRPEGMSRSAGTAMQTKPGTDMICDMIRLEGMSRPEGTAMQTKPGTDMICDMIRPGHGHNRPEMTKRTWPRAASRRGFAMKAPSY